jgi:hypothetical protein
MSQEGVSNLISFPLLDQWFDEQNVIIEQGLHVCLSDLQLEKQKKAPYVYTHVQLHMATSASNNNKSSELEI